MLIVFIFPIFFAYSDIVSFFNNGIFLLFSEILLQYNLYKFSIVLPGLYLINGILFVLLNNLNNVSIDKFKFILEYMLKFIEKIPFKTLNVPLLEEV